MVRKERALWYIDAPRSARSDGLEDEHRDLAGRPLLVLRVRRVGSDRPVPPLGSLVAGNFPGGHVPPVRAVLQLDPRVVPQVVVPLRMLRGAATGRHGGVAAVMLHPHHRRLAHLAAARPAVGDDHDGKAGVAQRRPLRATGTLIGLDLVAYPGLRARLVVTIDRHGPKSSIPEGGSASAHPRNPGYPRAVCPSAWIAAATCASREAPAVRRLSMVMCGAAGSVPSRMLAVNAAKSASFSVSPPDPRAST